MHERGEKLWRLRLFGGPILENSSGGSVVGFRSTKVVALLAYLGLHHGKACSRDALMEALWPGEPDSPARANRFRVTLASLRRQLEPEGFPYGSALDTAVPGCLRLSAETVWCDLTEFESALRQNDLARAAELAKGKLLPAIYEDWAADQQMRVELLGQELSEFRADEPRVLSEETEAPMVGHRLPSFLSKFFARDAELALLRAGLDEGRLVTITGPGGVGKTRISVEAARLSSVRAIFVPLAECADTESLAETLVRHLLSGTQTAMDPVSQLLEVAPKRGHIRLVLDNAEHLIEEVREVCAMLLDAAPELHLLVSSRQPLELEGERIVRIEPLGPTVAKQLFLDRLKQSRPDYVPSLPQQEVIASICERLEGLPLALELAAAQISIQSLAEILRNLDHSLVELKSRRRSLSARHRSLRAAIESSFTGLQPDLLKFLGSMTVFWGGWTAQQAHAITEEPGCLEMLEDLTLRSLVSSEMTESTVRFNCLEVVRRLAQERLSPGELARAESRHSEYFLSLAAQVDENDMGTLPPLDGEQLNLTAAFRLADRTDPGFVSASRGAILHAYIRGNHRAGLNWIREFSAWVDGAPNSEERREWWVVSLMVLTDVGLFAEAQSMVESLRRQSQELPDKRGLTQSLIAEGLISARQGKLSEAVSQHREALNLAESVGDFATYESALAHLSGTLHEVARLDDPDSWDVPALLEESAELSERLISIVSPQSRRHPLAYLLAGAARFYQRRWDEAESRLAAAVASADRLGITTVTMYALFFESEIARQSARQAEAEQKHARFQSLVEQTGVLLGGGTWG